MPRSTYYYIIARESEAIAEFQDLVVTNSREILWRILVNQNQLLQKLIEDGMAETTKPRERLAIYKALVEIRDKLAQALRMSSRGKTFAMEELQAALGQFAGIVEELGNGEKSYL